MMMMIRVVTVSLRSSHEDRQLSGRRHFTTTDRGLPHQDAPRALHATLPLHTVRGMHVLTLTWTRSELTSLLFSSLFGTWCQRGRKLEGSILFRCHGPTTVALHVLSAESRLLGCEFEGRSKICLCIFATYLTLFVSNLDMYHWLML
jgi:hypothetical protein